MRNLLDVIWPTSNDDVSKGMHLCITHEGLLKYFLPVWGQVSMMNGNIQLDVGARMWTEVREGIRAVMENVVIALEVQ